MSTQGAATAPQLQLLEASSKPALCAQGVRHSPEVLDAEKAAQNEWTLGVSETKDRNISALCQTLQDTS